MNAPIHIVPVRDALPGGFDRLRAEAADEGHRFVERLVAEWDAGTIRFDGDGEALLAAYRGDALAGIGGLTIDPVVPAVLRLRRFYVRPAHRRHGVGRAIVNALLGNGRRQTITVNAGTPDAEGFWQALGFQPDRRDGHTHVLPCDQPVRRSGR